MLALTKVQLQGVDLFVLGVSQFLIRDGMLRLQPLHLLSMLLRKPGQLIGTILLETIHVSVVLQG